MKLIIMIIIIIITIVNNMVIIIIVIRFASQQTGGHAPDPGLLRVKTSTCERDPGLTRTMSEPTPVSNHF